MPIEQNTKSLIKSKTFWKEFAVIVGSIATYVSGALEANVAIAAIVSGVVGIGIRAFMTNTGITGVFKE